MNKLFSVTLTAAFGVAAHAQIFVNGGFETGNFSGWTGQAAAIGSFYNVAEYPVDEFVAPPGGGVYFALFGAQNDVPDTISQTLGLNPGLNYQLTFYMGEDYTGTDENMTVTQSWTSGGGGSSTIFNGAAPVVPDGGDFDLSPYSFMVTGHSGGDTFSFAAYDTSMYIGLDEVGLTALPEPAPLLALGLGVVGLAIRRRRRS